MKKLTFLFFICFVPGLLLNFSQINAQATSQQDSLALVDLYNSTDGANWTNNNNWLTGNVSTWYGVAVSDGRVTSVNLDYNNLAGAITSLNGNLDSLETLSLQGNQLTGSIPSEYGNLTNLRFLNLCMNQLTESIPSEIGNLTNLQGLYLSGNQLTGSIPNTIGNLINLMYLIVEWNQLSGSIPTELWNLTNLRQLKFSDNQLSGTLPAEIGNLINLESFFIYSNSLSGAIPAEILNLTNLYGLWLWDNEFTDLPDLSSLTSLAELKISNNKFTFKDIEPNIGVAGITFIYAPQDEVGNEQDTTVIKGSSLTLAVSTGGSSSRYQWRRDWENMGPVSGDSTYTITSIEVFDGGSYTCEITNTVATELTLYSRPIHVTVRPPLDAGVVAILSPGIGCGLTNSESITVRIQNFGTDPVSDFDVGYTLNGVPINPETITDIILPGDALEYTFNAKADLYANEYYTRYNFESYTLLSGDECPWNNTLNTGIWVYGDYTDKEGWTTYSICDGLAGATTTGVVEDGSGNIWVGFGEGVSVFDGSTWITYNTGNSPLTSNWIETMFADDLGNVWIGTWKDEGGVCMYDGSSWTIYTTENSGIAGNRIEEIIKDSKGNYWFATYSGISKFDGSSTWTNYNTGNSGLVDDRTNAITEDSNGNIWIGTESGVSKFDVTGNTWTTYNTDNSGLESNSIYAVREDKQGNIWFGTWQGWVTKFDNTIWTTYTPENSDFPYIHVLSIMVDGDGNIWFGTFGGGAVKYDGTNWIIYNEKNGLANISNISGAIYFWADIFEDSNGNIWFPTYNGLAKKEPVNVEIYNVEYSHCTCNGTDNGTITIYALADNPPLQYSVDGGINYQPNNLFENLPPDTYSIAVTDGTDTVFAGPVTLLDFADISSFPSVENFDFYDGNSTEFDNGWYNETGNATDWVVYSGSTPTSNTGPGEDHTTGGGNYLYMEASGNYFKQASLLSPCFDISSLFVPALKFYYHMWGENMGELHIDIYAEGTWNEDLVVLSGDQGNDWHRHITDLSGYSGIVKLRFRGIIGDYAYSDIAIDDVEIIEGIDAGVISLISPEGSCGFTDSEDVTIEIINNGVKAISDFEVGYTLNGVPITPETVTDIILPGETLEYTFNTKADLYTNKYYTRYNFEFYALLPGDESPENNTLNTGILFFGDYIDKEGWTTYSICDGMAEGPATGVGEDGSGNIWIGIDGGGVNVFDGDTWTNYNTGNSPLTSNHVEKLYADDLGNIWIGTWQDEGGVCMYDGSSWTIYTTETSGISGNIVEEIIKDSKGNYWFATYNGISKFDGISTWTNYNTGNSGLVGDGTNAITEDSNGNIWVGTSSGVSKFDITGNTWTTYNTDNSGLMSNNIYAVREDKQGNIWFGTWQGWITRFDGTTWTTYTPENSGVTNFNVLSIMVDSDGNIWFGTFGGGAVKYDGTNWIIYNEKNGLAAISNVSGAIYFWADMYEDSNSNIWFPTYNGVAKKEPVNIEIYNIEYSHCTCNGTDDGTITIFALAENPPLQYSVDGGINYQSDRLFENLPPGTYSPAVTDGTDTVFADPVTLLDFADISSFPSVENFDSYEVNSTEFDNGWYNETGNATDWVVYSGSTPTSNTGPGEDHTTGGGNYLYMEANNNYFKQASLISPCFDISSLSIPTLRFYYHMWGESMGELHLDIYSDGTWIEDLEVFSGDQGNEWHRYMMDLSGYGDIVKLRFRGVIGDYAYSDIALDDIEIMEGPVDAVIMRLVTPPIPLPSRMFCGLTGNEQITVEIFNDGTYPLSNFDIGYAINGDSIVPENISATLQYGETISYAFNTTADLYSTDYVSKYSLDIYILLPGDENPINNSRHFNLNSFGDYNDKFRWTSYNSCDGLKDDHVFASFEDAQGNMWFSGFYGVSKFDGTSWTTYTSADGLANDYTWAMTEDSQGNIWFATVSGGITKYDGTNFTIHETGTWVFDECVYEDSQGNIWFGSFSGDGVLKFDGTYWAHYTHDEGLLGNVVLSISEDKNGNMLFSSYDGVSLFDGANWSELLIAGQSSLHISEIFKDSHDNVWFTETYGNIYKFNGTEWTTYTTEDGIINHRCEDIAEDSHGNLWFGGGMGINKFNGTDWQTLTPEEGLIECPSGIFSVTVDNQDNIWFGTGNYGVSKYVSVPTVQHFAVVWTGNGVDHMNFYVLSATLDGSDLQPGDEIAVFDGDYCVGAGVITEVLGDGVFLDFVASRNDAVPPGANGYTPGNEVLFRIWDASEDKEIDNIIVDYISGEGIYSIGGTVSFNLTASSEIDQLIDLTSGWNIMSFNVEPQDMGMDLILQTLVNGGVLVKVQDETGQAIENVPPIGWIYNIGDMSPAEGYKIKVNSNAQLLSTGYAVELPFSIPLDEGWNIMGYPASQEQDAQQMLSGLISEGSLLKVQDEQGHAIENVPPIGWIYNIQSFEPGEGYKIKVSVNTNLLVTAGTKKSAFIQTSDPGSEHFIPSWGGNGLDHMNIYLISPTIGGQKLNPGDEIGVFDGAVCVGYGIVRGPDQEYLSLVATKDDPTTDKRDGFTEGNPIHIVLWIAGADVEKQVSGITVASGFTSAFEKLGTTVLYADFEPYVESFLGDAYPNPFTDQTMITYGLGSDTHVKIEIYNIIGEKLAVLVNRDQASGIYQVTWEGSDQSGIHLSPGIYFYKMVTGDYSGIKRVVFIK